MAKVPKNDPSTPLTATEAWTVAQRWTPTLISDGFTPVSNFFLTNYHRLTPPVTTAEAMLVLQLVKFKWDFRPPQPSFTVLAANMGVTMTSVRGHARSLQRKGYLTRIRRYRSTNQFDLTPLFNALERLRKTTPAKGLREPGGPND